MLDKSEWEARFKLSRVDGIGPSTFLKLIQKFGSLKELIENVNDIEDIQGTKLVGLIKATEQINTEGDIEICKKCDVNVSIYGDENYPKIFENFSQPPGAIYYKGEIQKINFGKAISIVGTRKMTDYGRLAVNSIVHGLVQKGFATVSGMAFGVDKEVHNKTIDYGGRTVAVLGSSANKPTPASNTKVYKRILENGGVIVSEIFPTDEIPPGAFPRRNRIIAGLSLGTVVIEAAKKSGSLITSDIAFAENKEVFAVPGQINMVNSEGCNNLIRENKAKLITSAEDILNELGFVVSDNGQSNKFEPKNNTQKQIMESVSMQAITTDELVHQLGLSANVSTFLAEISELELEGVIQKGTDGKFRAMV